MSFSVILEDSTVLKTFESYPSDEKFVKRIDQIFIKLKNLLKNAPKRKLMKEIESQFTPFQMKLSELRLNFI